MEHPPHQPTFDIAEGNHRQLGQIPSVMPNLGKGKGKRLRDWDEAETSALLECVNLPHFRHQKRSQSYMKWDAIAEEIQNRLGRTDSAITGKRCRDRMKTLKGYWHQVRTKKKNADVTEDEWRKSNGLAVDWWYGAIGDFQAPRKGKLICTPNTRKSAKKQIAARFNSLNDSRRSTLLDLRFWWRTLEEPCCELCEDHVFGLISEVCEWLSIVQVRSGSAIYEDVIALVKMGLVSWHCHDGMGKGSDDDISQLPIQLSSLKVDEKFFKKVMDRNPTYDTRRIIEDEAVATFDATCAPQGITLLYLRNCEELEVVDLSAFRKLRYLCIWRCRKLREMIGWECLEELGWLVIFDCPSYDGRPPLQKIPSLQSFRAWGWQFSTRSRVDPGGELDVSGCVRLRKLEIHDENAFSSFRGLEGLRSLIELDLDGCKALQNLPDICHMKDLTRLSISETAVEEIKGVEKLLSLEHLYCSFSKLKTLPDLSHLPHLRHVILYDCPLTKDPSSPYFGIADKYFKRENKHVDVSDTSDSER